MENAIDKFSWYRVWMVARYMFPTLKKQLILYPIVITLFTLSGVMFNHLEVFTSTEVGIFNTLCGFLFYFAPVSLARRDNRFVIVQLPANTSEKFVFLLIYYWIVIGILTIGLGQVINMFISMATLLDTETQKMVAELTGILGNRLTYVMWSGTLCGIALQVFTLYGVVNAKTNRMTTGIVYAIGSYVGMCVLSGIIGGLLAFFNIREWKYRFDELEVENNLPEEFAADLIADVLPVILTIVTGILCILAAIFLYKTYKIIKHRGF